MTSGSSWDKIPSFSKLIVIMDKIDIRGDKQVLFMGTMYNYLRKILFKPASNSALFIFISRTHDAFEKII